MIYPNLLAQRNNKSILIKNIQPKYLKQYFLRKKKFNKNIVNILFVTLS